MAESARDAAKRISLCEALDRVFNKGVVLQGDIVISVANVDLLYLGLRVLLASVETAQGAHALSAGLGVLGPSPLPASGRRRP